MWRRFALAVFLLAALLLPVLPVAADDEANDRDGEGGEDDAASQGDGGDRQGKEEDDRRGDDGDRDGEDNGDRDGDDDGDGDEMDRENEAEHEDEEKEEKSEKGEGRKDDRKHKERSGKEDRAKDDDGDGRGHGDGAPGQSKGRGHASKDRGKESGGDPDDAAPGSPGRGWAAQPTSPSLPDDLVGPVLPGILPDAELVLEQSHAVEGDRVTFTFLVANAGLHMARDVRLHDALPDGHWRTLDPRCALDGDVLACALGDLPPGALARVDVSSDGQGGRPDLANTVQATALRG